MKTGATKLAVLIGVGALFATVAVLSAPADTAEAHVLTVDGEEVAWVGGPPIDEDEDQLGQLPEAAQGEGLMDHPFEGHNQPAAHGTGLISACEALRDADQDVVDIWGPLDPATCEHGE